MAPRSTRSCQSPSDFTPLPQAALLSGRKRKLACSVRTGIFNVNLGAVTTLPHTVFSNGALYLGVTVGNDVEMSPRTQVVSVGYSYRVGSVDGATGGTVDGDMNITGRAAIGSLHTNTGVSSFVAGSANAGTGDFASISGGSANIAGGIASSIGGGNGNRADSLVSTVGGGNNNRAAARSATVGGGSYNAATGTFSTIGGGGGVFAADSNSASGVGAGVLGGAHNYASGIILRLPAVMSTRPAEIARSSAADI